MRNFNEVYSVYSKLTNDFFDERTKKDIREKSQYFTPILEAEKLVEDIKILEHNEIKILDPACGNGILVFKLLEKIFKTYKPKKIEIDVYDIDNMALNNFKKLVKLIEVEDVKLVINYFNMDFLKINIHNKYNYIIMNPPYKKVNVSDVPQNLLKYVYGQPNLYHLFIANVIDKLTNDGVISIISPKNYLSGMYTEKLRDYIINNLSITKIHTFNDRRNVFKNKITQEVCIVQINKVKNENVIIAYNNEPRFKVKLQDIILKDKFIIFTPRNIMDYKLIKRFIKFPIRTIGTNIIMNVGKVVQFRIKNKDENLKDKEYYCFENAMPLIVYRHIRGEKLNYGQLTDKKNNRAITLIDDNTNTSIFIKNANYLFIRKNIDKKYDKLIHCIGYFGGLDSTKLAIDNGIVYFTNKQDNLTREEVVGLQCILMSKQFDAYYRMINSSHTINVYELENMHFPDIETIRLIGKNMKDEFVSVEGATEIFEKYL